MPIYAYRCDSCGLEKDVLQKISDAPLSVCPTCGAESFRKKLTAPAFQLKGTGWYVTDFRDNGKKPASDGSADKGASDKEGAGERPAEAKAGEAAGSKSDDKSSDKAASKAVENAAGKAVESSPGKAGERSSGKAGEKAAGTPASAAAPPAATGGPDKKVA